MSDPIRVKDKDTGYHRTIRADQIHLGNYERLKSDAVDPVSGEVLPPKFPATTTGQQADTSKEK
jgi:hypothetical protein